jgi:hypothetical protein
VSHSVTPWLFQYPIYQDASDSDKRLAKKVHGAILATLLTVSEADQTILLCHCNMALCEMMFEALCDMALEPGAEIGELDAKDQA